MLEELSRIMTSNVRFCGSCGQELSSIDTNYCSRCGKRIDQSDTLEIANNKNDKTTIKETEKRNSDSHRSVVITLPYKSPGTAALIAFIGGLFGLPGIGHIYVGKVGKGIGILILGLVIYAFMVISILGFSPVGFLIAIVYLILLIWQIFSARGNAKKFNKSVKETGKEPW